jgi:arylsulfatase A-like enzyme
MATEQAAKPNIVLITTDQQRYDTTGERKPPFLRTPHLENLAREGITFRRAYADCPICVPSRISIMTGKTVFAHGNPSFRPSSEFIDARTSLPACLRALGYQTAAIGKMHFTPERARHGFDEMILPADYYAEMARSGSPVQPMRHGLGQNELYPGLATVPEAMTLTNWIAEQCVHYVRDRRDPTAPFFLWCSFSKPHPPLDPPEPYYSMYQDSPIPEPVRSDWADAARAPEAFLRAQQSWSNDLIPPEVIRAARAAYYGLITQIDYNIGRVLAALLDVNLLNDALILFTSDHGEYLGDHSAGAKTFFHEPSAHVPMILRLPKRWADRGHGTACDHLVTLADVLPTCVGAAGGTPPDSADGMDLTAVARGSTAPRELLLASANSVENPMYLGVTDGRWKYIWWPEGEQEQLFDLASDPDERHDLGGASDAANVCRDMRERLTAWLRTRAPHWLADGALPTAPRRGDSEIDRRNSAWPGYHTDWYVHDVRH